jgi:hypothetical protein
MRPERGYVSLVSVRSFSCFCAELPLILTVGIFVRLQGLGFYKPSLPPVLEDAVGRVVRRVPRRRKRRRRTRKRPGPASGCGLGKPWRGIVKGRRGTGSRGSHRHEVPRAPEVEATLESAAGLPSVAPARAEARGASPQARLALVRSG